MIQIDRAHFTAWLLSQPRDRKFGVRDNYVETCPIHAYLRAHGRTEVVKFATRFEVDMGVRPVNLPDWARQLRREFDRLSGYGHTTDQVLDILKAIPQELT